MKTIIALVVATSLYGCAHNPNAGDDANLAKQKEILARHVTCGDNLQKNSALKPLLGKVYIGGGAAPFPYLTNESIPNEEEKAALVTLATELNKCHTIYEEQFKLPMYPQAYAAIHYDTAAKSDALRADLYNGKLTYGGYAKAKNEMLSALHTNSAQAERIVRKDAEESNALAAQAQAQSTQAVSSSMMAGAAMANAYKPTPVAPIVTPRSTMTNCTTTPDGLGGLRTTCY